MKTLKAHVSTPHGERYIARLCRHFSHKIPATWEGTRGEIHFDMGTCKLEANETALLLRAEAENGENVQTVADVTGSHLERFAAGGREGEKLTVAWAP
ncbi:DUF2218 domain-containing protein [Hydrocarboniclastica marina]|uniref:DUF2218 domain-containing protein n=1 Tax=Hydrocarboniclastica marina TaxID=2259620 RepID=A0A4P7XL27_9ALTE|nr:DUF2218 domain-containing protein [Hydrocarboniclastica marina]MAM00208.1 2,4-dihydroxyhept-2-ene-1,7-dioic acid aldolase [Alteromonadaceae bacterium]QCF27543.1 DUF2218 domain-containing protein [Hydrocarboniclastica marina]|tara:strand:+ start:1116 stop:1409 length:294 start_codon:yes stop_codon:yes gene_type:complete